ncbi:D-alanyl-D-alanine carboxypeptidase [Candidatus Saccharibacteria bacterium]|nr:D-alanyl-D-alanine carboxypeptidase [Candidatus Saccharibacteria bacterium]
MKKWAIGIIAFVLLATVFVGTRMIFMPVNISFAHAIQLPDIPAINDIIPKDLSEKVAVAIDGRVVFQNSDKVQATASTAKMIMAVMVMEKKPFKLGEVGETIVINRDYYNRYLYYATHNGSNTRVQLGENISEYDALASALLASSNNMADTLAMWAFGSFEEYKLFAETKLKEWGLNNTTIGIDACGYSNTTTSTAADLAIIAQKLMGNPVLAEIVGLKTHVVPVAGELKNTNKLLGKSGILGIKTGWIGESSGYCLATAYKTGEHLISLIVLGAQTRDESFDRSKMIIDALQDALKEIEIAKKDQEVGYYQSWWGGKTTVTAREDASVFSWAEAKPTLTIAMNDYVEDREVIGELVFKSENTEKAVRVSTSGFKASPTFWDRLKYALFISGQ